MGWDPRKPCRRLRLTFRSADDSYIALTETVLCNFWLVCIPNVLSGWMHARPPLIEKANKDSLNICKEIHHPFPFLST